MEWDELTESVYYMTGIGGGTKKVITEYMREGINLPTSHAESTDWHLVREGQEMHNKTFDAIMKELEELTRKLDGVNWYKFKERHELKKSIHWLEAVLEFL